MICQRCAKDVSINPIHTCTPSALVRWLIDALAQARAEITMLRAELNALRGYDPCASKDHGEAAAAATRS